MYGLKELNEKLREGNRPKEPVEPKQILPTEDKLYIPPHMLRKPSAKKISKTGKKYANSTRPANYKAS